VADLDWAFGATGLTDKAKHIATLYVEDIADFIRENIDAHFDLVRYAERLSVSAPTFDKIHAALQAQPSLIDELMLQILDSYILAKNPDIIGFTVPFPGCLFSALRCAQHIKKQYPYMKIVMGGGYVNTELRNISDVRIFDYVDFITLDDGELPLEKIILFLQNKESINSLVRTFYINEDKVLVYSENDEQNIRFAELPAPDFSNLPSEKYISLVELTNPMHKLWTDGAWNKLTVAHGCYWAKCAFCDTSLDYICRYEAPTAAQVVDKIEAVMKQTGRSGFHFTDEALPPKLLKEIAEEILRRNLIISFWGNIRFEKNFTPQLCNLLAKAGCIAVSGGLEVASDRLLLVINKGVNLQQAVRSTQAFTEAGIMVHAYLMYGFPTQTLAEAVNALEVVRQMFDEGLVQSAFWHKLAVTAHSSLGKNPQEFGVKILQNGINSFANNDLPYTDGSKVDWEMVGVALSKATYNFMHDVGLDFPLHSWFAAQIPKTTVPKNLVSNSLS
ncbi:MAG: radical SAM protein, partial [Prevotellaceae bacterium]|nr:radical SAM protein [Prevotellaceae bacterium]